MALEGSRKLAPSFTSVKANVHHDYTLRKTVTGRQLGRFGSPCSSWGPARGQAWKIHSSLRECDTRKLLGEGLPVGLRSGAAVREPPLQAARPSAFLPAPRKGSPCPSPSQISGVELILTHQGLRGGAGRGDGGFPSHTARRAQGFRMLRAHEWGRGVWGVQLTVSPEPTSFLPKPKLARCRAAPGLGCEPLCEESPGSSTSRQGQ